MPDTSNADSIALTAPPPPRRAARKRAPAVFVGAVVITLLTIAGLELAGYSHAGLVFLVFLYGGVLPALLWYWRESRVVSRLSSADPLRLPDLRIPAILAFAAITVFTSYSYDHGHTIPDESAYLFQARIFASGQLKAEPMPGATPLPTGAPVEIYFEHQIQTTNGWFGKYPPGWPLALAIGYLAGCPWLVNPALGILLLLLVNGIAGAWGRLTQIIAVVLVAFSAYAMLYSMGFLSHALAAAVGIASLAAAFRGVREVRLRWIFVCFALVILGTEIRPYDGLVIAALCAGYTLFAFLGNRAILWRSIAIISVTAFASIALFLLVNRFYTGNFLVSLYAWSRGSIRVHELTLNPVLIARNLETAWRWAATDTLSVSFPFIFLAASYACAKEIRFRRELIALAILFPLLAFAYCFQSESSSSFDGERYYYSGYAAMCIVAARGFVLLIERWRVDPRAARRSVLALAIIHALFIAIMIRDVEARLAPWRLAYRASIKSPARDLVFLSVSRPPGSTDNVAAKHANWNDARWKTAHTVFLNDPGAARRGEVACRFHRPSYRVVQYDGDIDTVTSQDFVVACRPGS